jgi:hydroxyacylglutathione hydrolase
MIVRRFFHPRLAQSSYLIGCSTSREAIVLDPLRYVEPYVAAASDERVRITAVSETHVHADFLSGSRELALRTGAQLYLSGEGRGPWSYTDDYVRGSRAMLLHDAYVIRVGTVRVDVIRTPGHTPEHLTFLITDTAGAGEPMAAVTGDFLFVGDVGRPDLLERAVQVVGSADGAARQLFHSLARMSSYADYLQVWPGHSAGSACGKGLSAVPHSTLGYERRHNWAFRTEDEEAFVADVLQGQPEPPLYFAKMKRANAQGPPPWSEVARPEVVSADAVVAAVAGGAVVVDTRPAAEYAAGHLAGTIGIPLDRSFLNWSGSLIPSDSVIMLIGGGAESELQQAAADLGLIGLDHVSGIAGEEVLEKWRRSGEKFVDIPETTVADVGARQRGGSGNLTLLDVRNESEWVGGHIPDAMHVALATLPLHLETIPRDRPIVVHCQHGARAVIAAGVLQAAGFKNIEHMSGGFQAWHAAGQSVVAGTATAA